MANIKHEVANDSKGQVICISKAVSGSEYFCRGCGGRMTAKMGVINQHHFAHVSDCTNHNYQPETEEHYQTKLTIAKADKSFHKDVIRYYTDKEVRIISVEVEKGIKGFVADVLVKTDQGDYAFEVVQTHYSTPEKINALGDKMIELEVNSWLSCLRGSLTPKVIKSRWLDLVETLVCIPTSQIKNEKLVTLQEMIQIPLMPYIDFDRRVQRLSFYSSEQFQTELDAVIKTGNEVIQGYLRTNNVELTLAERDANIKNYPKPDFDITGVEDWI